MKTLEKLWNTLEVSPGLRAVDLEWQDLLGSEYASLRQFLRPTGDLSISYPCAVNGGDNCPQNVIIHSPNNIVAVCANSPKMCDRRDLQRSDIVLYHFDRQAFSAEMARQLGIVRRPIVSTTPLMCLGEREFGSRRLQFHLTLSRLSMDTLQQILDIKAGARDSTQTIVVPSIQYFDKGIYAWLEREGILVLCLDETLSIAQDRLSLDPVRFILQYRLETDDPGKVLWPARFLVLDPQHHRYWLCGQRMEIPADSQLEILLLELSRNPGKIVTRLWMAETFWPTQLSRTTRDPHGNKTISGMANDINVLVNKLRGAVAPVLSAGDGHVPSDPKKIISTMPADEPYTSGFSLDIAAGRIYWRSG